MTDTPPPKGQSDIGPEKRRKAFRRAMELDCEALTEGGAWLVALKTVDLSPEGVLVEGEGDVDVGDEVVFTLLFPDGTHSEIVADVVRKEELDGGEQSRFALRFTKMDEEGQIRLKRHMPPPLPPPPAPPPDYVSEIYGLLKPKLKE